MAGERRQGRVQDSFGLNAEKYVASPSHADPAELRRLVDLVAPRGGRLLDLATGAGHCGLAFAPFVDSVVLADLTPQMLAVAAQQAAARGLANVTTRQVEVSELPFAGSDFDYVTCRLAAHHFPDQAAALAEMCRVLRPGGMLLFVDNVVPEDPEAAAFINEFERIRDASHARCLSGSVWTELIQGAGFLLEDRSVRRKAMDFDQWTSRLNVAPADLDRLSTLLDAATGAAASSLAPRSIGGRRGFDLIEVTFLARRPTAG